MSAGRVLPLPPPPTPPAAAAAGGPTLSVVVVNHNYERFLRAAVDSALGQRGASVEVVVVDDGSTDASRDVLASYGDRIRPVLQANAGQAAAFNAGLAAASGELILFLDADDLLEPDVAAEAIAAFDRDPSLVRVAFRLAIIDESGRPTGEMMPAVDVPLPVGDVRRQVLAYGDDLAWPPTSGNVFAGWALRRIMPLPVEDERIDADSWLHTTVPLLGAVAALPAVGGRYRAHGANHAFRASADVERSRRVIATTLRVRRHVAELSHALAYGPPQARSVTMAAHRMVSLRLGGPGHPIPDDRSVRAARDGIVAAWHRDDVAPVQRAAYAAWFAAMLGSPRSWCDRLATWFFVPARRPRGMRDLLRRGRITIRDRDEGRKSSALPDLAPMSRTPTERLRAAASRLLFGVPARMRRRSPDPRDFVVKPVLTAFAQSTATRSVTFVQIGSNDGTTGDPLRELAESHSWSGVLVEPVPYVFARLRAQRGADSRVRLENAAIADSDGVAQLHHLRPRRDGEDLPEWYDQLGSFSLPTILKHEEAIPNIRDLLVSTEVRTLTFDSLCAKHQLPSFDLLHIDVEGFDWEVLRQIDLQRYQPDIVLYERVHLSDGDAAAARRRLETAGYSVLDGVFDTVAVRRKTLATNIELRHAWQSSHGLDLAKYAPASAA